MTLLYCNFIFRVTHPNTCGLKLTNGFYTSVNLKFQIYLAKTFRQIKIKYHIYLTYICVPCGIREDGALSRIIQLCNWEEMPRNPAIFRHCIIVTGNLIFGLVLMSVPCKNSKSNTGNIREYFYWHSTVTFIEKFNIINCIIFEIPNATFYHVL